MCISTRSVGTHVSMGWGLLAKRLFMRNDKQICYCFTYANVHFVMIKIGILCFRRTLRSQPSTFVLNGVVYLFTAPVCMVSKRPRCYPPSSQSIRRPSMFNAIEWRAVERLWAFLRSSWPRTVYAIVCKETSFQSHLSYLLSSSRKLAQLTRSLKLASMHPYKILIYGVYTIVCASQWYRAHYPPLIFQFSLAKLLVVSRYHTADCVRHMFELGISGPITT